MNQRSNQLARLLRTQGVRPGNIVGIMVERSPAILIGIMGILKAGGAYLPLDPGYPTDRIEYLLADAQAMLVLSQPKLAEKFKFPTKVLGIEETKQLTATDIANLEPVNSSQDLAYLIYTSGSTGKPKGVMIEHRAVHNFIRGITQQIRISSGKTILGLTTIAFDIFALETILPLTIGLTVALAGENEQSDPRSLSELMSKNKIDLLQTTPSRMQQLLNSDSDLSWLKALKILMIGGNLSRINC